MGIPLDVKLRVGEVARLTGLSADQVRRLCNKGLLRFEWTDTGQRLITVASVEAYVSSGLAPERSA